MNSGKDTIAAISTPLMSGGIGIIRISGPQAKLIAGKVFKSRHGSLDGLEGYRALFGKIYDGGEVVDECVALNYNAPASYTGEDVVELSCHGGVFLLKKVLSLILNAGARLAEPGEFSKRAFLNGKMDLSQAEAVMDIISAKNSQALRAANAMKDGALSRKISDMRHLLTGTTAHLSAWIDFPDDDIPQVETDEIKSDILKIIKDIDALLSSYDSGVIMREGIPTVIAGRPNAGKSTIMNLISGQEKSIVTDIEGTTRDIIEETVMAGGIMLRLADTAGLRHTGDVVEKIGVRKTHESIENAGLILAVFDGSKQLCKEDLDLCEACRGRAAVAIINKDDLEKQIDESYIRKHFRYVVNICAKERKGLKNLTQAIAEAADYSELDASEGMLANERQKGCAVRARGSLMQALREMEAGQTPDIVCVLLDEALSALFEMSGELATDAVVDEIFSNFCIGK